MGVQIGAKPDSGFDDPIGMLRDCHRRIERFVHILSLVAEQARGRSLSEEESSAVTAALHYFQEGGRRHNADEEESLFPRLRAADSDYSQTSLAHLEDDHRHTEHLHQRVEALYRMWIDAAALSTDKHQALLSAVSELERIYTEHIRTEESTVFPRAAQVLDKGEIAAIGSEFQVRRR